MIRNSEIIKRLTELYLEGEFNHSVFHAAYRLAKVDQKVHRCPSLKVGSGLVKIKDQKRW